MKILGLVGIVLAMCCVQNITASDEFEALIASCSDIVEGLTDDLKARYRANEFPDDPVTHCFVRCLGLTLKLYDDERGPNLEANWEHLGSVGDETEFVTEHRRCLDGIERESGDDECAKAYRAFQCFKDEYFMDTQS